MFRNLYPRFFLLLALLFAGCLGTGKLVEEETLPEPQEEDVYSQVEQSLRAGDSEAALKILEKVIAEDPEDLNGGLFFSAMAASQGRFSEARETLDRLLARYPETDPGARSANTRILLQLAVLEGAQGRAAEEFALLSMLQEREPETSDVWSALGDYYLRRGDPQTAGEMYLRALDIDPYNLNALAGGGTAALADRDYIKAEDLLDRFVRIEDSDGYVYADRAKARMGQAKFREAETDLTRAVELNPDYWNYIDRGKLRLMNLGRVDDALEDFTRAAEIDPDYFYAYVFRAGILDNRDRFSEAIADYKTLLRLNPDYTFAYKSLGILQYITGDWEGARNSLLESSRHEDDTGLLFLAGYTYYRQGREREGRNYFTDLVNKIPQTNHFYGIGRTLLEPGYVVFVQRSLELERDLFVKTRMKFYLGAAYEALAGAVAAAPFYREVQSMNLLGLYELRIAVKALEAMGDRG
ncbi:MAG: tetratricopeptide repeat protein [Spirochaetales bacterium]|jgi:tetratricopeptide (TPR) repeat protein|nr:tetratricopeptide repeat protein [Spirochaetales bacterium]